MFQGLSDAEIESLARSGDLNAVCAVVRRVLTRFGPPEEREIALALLKDTAEAGHAEAQFYLGWLLVEDRLHGFKPIEGEIWLQRAAGQGHLQARGLLLHRMYRESRVPDGGFRIACERLAAENEPFGLTLLGLCHQTGFDGPADPERALACYEEAALAGDPGAHLKLGEWHMAGNQKSPDAAKAFAHFLNAAQSGSSDACLQAGHCYEFGLGTRANTRKALEWYKAGATMGHAACAAALTRNERVSMAQSGLLFAGFGICLGSFLHAHKGISSEGSEASFLAAGLTLTVGAAALFLLPEWSAFRALGGRLRLSLGELLLTVVGLSPSFLTFSWMRTGRLPATSEEQDLCALAILIAGQASATLAGQLVYRRGNLLGQPEPFARRWLVLGLSLAVGWIAGLAAVQIAAKIGGLQGLL